MFREPQQQQVIPNTCKTLPTQHHESEDSTVVKVDTNEEQPVECNGTIDQMVLPETEILENSEHNKKLKNVRQNMTQKDNCKWSECSEVLEMSDVEPSETPVVVSTPVESKEPVIDGKVQPIQQVVEVEDEVSMKTHEVTDNGKANAAVIFLFFNFL